MQESKLYVEIIKLQFILTITLVEMPDYVPVLSFKHHTFSISLHAGFRRELECKRVLTSVQIIIVLLTYHNQTSSTPNSSGMVLVQRCSILKWRYFKAKEHQRMISNLVFVLPKRIL